MMKILLISMVFIGLFSIPSVSDDAENPLSIFQQYADKIWIHNNGKKGKGRFHDISTWKWILGGKAIRTAHSVNDGSYQGETHIFYDPTAKLIKMHYVTTAGFHTKGYAIKAGNEIHFFETVHGAAGDISNVEAKSSILENGDMQVSSRMQTKGKWSPWSSYVYVEQK